LLQRIRKQSPGGAVADLSAADYIGALIGGLAFPFLLLPLFGQLRGVVVVGAVNAVAGLLLVFTVFRGDVGRRGRWTLIPSAIAVSALLVGCYAYADRFEASAQQALFAHPIVYQEHTDYQQIVMTESISPFGDDDLRLFLNGDLQFSSVDEYRYHESLVHPAMSGDRSDVLVLGGGDGLALREVLRYPDVDSATLVELDPAMTELGRTHPKLAELNENAFDDPRVDVVNADAFKWLEQQDAGAYDVIVVDMPDPDSTTTAKLYSVEFYGMAASVLADSGRMSIQSGSPYFAPKSFWCVNETVAEAGLEAVPYQASVPSFGDWGFHLAAKDAAPQLRIDAPTPPRYLDEATLAASSVFPADRAKLDVPASTVLDPVIMEYARSEWRSGA
ncbi:MAG: polyamine aminopropyltransferase, partial [Stackebrandtia sp.]